VRKEVKHELETPFAAVRTLNKMFPQYTVTIQRKADPRRKLSETLAERKRSLIQSKTREIAADDAPETRRDASQDHAEVRDRAVKMTQLVVSVQPLIRQGINEEDIMSALAMIDEMDEDARITSRFHRPTGLLFIKTRFKDIGLIDEMMDQLEVTAYTGPERSFTRNRNHSNRN
jgi:alkylhydroperoxidase/carboxymuconolactone decarboxylase family protein YurZ